MLHQQNTFPVSLNEDDFPSLTGTRSKDLASVNTSADCLSYCAKLKNSQHEKIKNERAIYSDESFYKPVASKNIQTTKQDLEISSRFSFESEMFMGKLSENNPTQKSPSQLLNLSHSDDQESATVSDKKDKGWVVVKKKTPHSQTDENNKTKIECRSFKNQTISGNNAPLPKHRAQNMQCTSKKNNYDDTKLTSSLQNKVIDKKYVSKSYKFQFEEAESVKSIDYKKVDILHKPKYVKDSNKQSKNSSSHVNYSNAVRTFNKKNQFVKERNSSPKEKLISPDTSQKEQLSILNKTLQKNFGTRPSLNKQKAVSFPKNKTESNEKFNPKKDFASFTNQNKKDLNKSLSSNFFKEGEINSNQSITGSTKKKRKSKVKRQVAMQSDKIRIITPELYSKIRNSSNDEKVQFSKAVSVNIYDSNEYPELGSSLVSALKLQKDSLETYSKEDIQKNFNLMIEKNDIDSGNIECSEENSDYLKDHDVSVESKLVEDECCEPKKLPVHYNNPITISFSDMISVNKSKKKEAEKSKEFPGNLLSSKFTLKKQTLSDHHQIVNPLDSSKPSVKRGKERENPKPKRLSKFKKIILLDREKRKELILKQYMLKEFYEEKGAFSPIAKPSEITNEKNLMKVNASDFINVEMERLSQINNRNNISVECESLPGHTQYLNLYSSSENNVIISRQDIDSCTNVNDDKLEIISKNAVNYPEEKSPSEIKPSCIDSSEIFIENATGDIHLQMHSNPSKYKIKQEEMENKEPELFHCEREMHNAKFEKLENVGELSESSKTVQDCTSNPSLTNETESNKYVNSLATLYKDTCYESNLNEVQYLFKNLDSSQMFSEEQNLDKILCDIQCLFLGEGDINIFSCKEITTELHYNFINDVKNNKKENNNLCNLSNDNMQILEKMKYDCSLIQTVCCNFENSDKICTYMKSETENVPVEKVNCGNCCIVQAVYIILHSKKFRNYCNHFSSKKLGESVLALLEDLTRFQDRMHQKDPIKARMKRRLIYGIKEIKRHMKLKKLKCIIIATDIEDSKSKGSLNDVINDLKALAKDYHVPCVFSHLRKKLGQVCHKPAPVSAVGVLNYEGSEINFKKMLELHSECKIDYEKVFKSLLSKLTVAQVELLNTTKAKDSASLFSVVISILKELFSHSNEIDESNNQNISNLPEEVVLRESHKSKRNKDAVEAIEVNNILVKYNVLSQ